MKVRLVSASIVAVTASCALADIIEMRFTDTGRGHSLRLTMGENSVNAFAGQLIHEVDSATGRGRLLVGAGPMFCTDLYQHASSQLKPYEIVPLAAAPDSAPMEPRKASALRDLYALAGGDQLDLHGSNDYAAAFQLAIWEIVSDYDPDIGRESLDIADGWFRASKTNGNPIATNITTHLDDLFDAVGSGGEFAGLVALSSPAAQDQLAVIPSTGSSGVVAAGLLLAIARRRR